MKNWLRDKVPFPVKLALKRQLGRLSRWRNTNGSAWTNEVPTQSTDGLDFEEVKEVAAAVIRPSGSGRQALRASIIIPVFNKAEFTFQCIRSLIDQINFADTQVIVINNASTDETKKLLSYFSGFVDVIENNANLGFVDACNQAAAQSKGRFLVFLNNDTIVLPGWLDALIETIERDERIGVVGSLLLYPDGKVQEGGSIVWNTGDACHYGWGASPDDHRLTFARDVDYCSGASLLIRKSLFDQLGGFDGRYAPAYYEDVDLCFGARSLGYRVVYQPASRVIHYEGITAGRNIESQTKRYQPINRNKFFEKWKEVLNGEHFDNAKQNIEQAAHRTPKVAVIVFDDRIPTPDLDAGSARMLLILQLLARYYRTVFVYQREPSSPHYEEALWKEGIQTLELIHYSRLLKNQKFQTAIISRPDLARSLLKPLRRKAPEMKIIFDTVDAHYRRLERQYQLTGDSSVKRKAEHYRKIELELVRECDMLWCTSIEDEKALTVNVPGKAVAIIPTIHPPHTRGRVFADREGLLFIGNFNHTPNQDAVEFFVEKVMPLIRTQMPGVRFNVVGSNAPPKFDEYSSEVVSFHGYVPDIEPLFTSSRVFVAPLRFGAGVKGKIGDALSFGLPVVTTDIGAEGMDLENENQALIANDAEEFAAAVVKVYRESDLWQRLSDNGYEHIRKHFSPAAVEQTIIHALA